VSEYFAQFSATGRYWRTNQSRRETGSRGNALQLAIDLAVLGVNRGIAIGLRTGPGGPGGGRSRGAVMTPAPEFAAEPDEWDRPGLLVPGGGAASFVKLPAPLGWLPELFRPPASAGPMPWSSQTPFGIQRA
jgi:hypothetical protein